MNPFRLLPKRLKRRMFRYTPAGFPDPAACGAFYDVRHTVFSGDDMMVLEYSSVQAQRRLFERAISLPYESYHGIDVSERMVQGACRRFVAITKVRRSRCATSLPILSSQGALTPATS